MTLPDEELLYHYTDPTGLLGILKSRSVWATKIQYMNDAEEFAHAISVAKGVLRQMARESGSESFSRCCEEISDSLERVEQVNVCAFSLSERGDLLSQWRAYCRDGGYSIGFEPDFLTAVVEPQGFSLQRCIYGRSEKRSLLLKILEPVVASLNRKVREGQELEEAREEVVGELFERFCTVAPRIKHPTFREEEEWRLISVPIPTDSLDFRPTSELAVPYYDLSLFSDDIGFQTTHLVAGPSQHQRLALQGAISLASSEGIRWGRGSISDVPYREFR